MPRKKAPEKPPNHERWLVSYGDFITLLMAVFVTLYAMSQTDKQKAESLIHSLNESFGYVKNAGSSSKPSVLDSADVQKMPALKPETAYHGGRARNDSDMQELEGELLDLVDRQKIGGSVDVRSGEGGVRITVDGDLFFEPGRSLVDPHSFIFLDELGAILRRHDQDVRVEGHTDGMPVQRSYPTNFHLSSERALSVLRYLVEVANLPPERIAAVAYGDTRPLVSNDTVEGRRKNRRVEFFIQKKPKPPG